MRNDPRRMAALIAAALLPSYGCSWILVHKAPPEPIAARPPVECTQSVAAPVVDTALTAVLAGAGIATIVMAQPKSGGCTGGWGCIHLDFSAIGYAVGGVLVAGAVPMAFSAGYGYSATADCREVAAAQLSCVSGVEASCRRLEVGPPPEPNPGARCTTAEDCKGGTVCEPAYGVCVGSPATAPRP